ncbi:hypothetical protein BGZ83_011655 [Gryganskiella cystojenkinii]|nr:hypothetical protein BGZ83_011655 [Gryganskiella cystojenkinii]
MDNALDSLPPCKGVDMNSTNVNNITDPSQLSPAYKNCICTMVSSTNWFASCFSTPGGCSNEWLSDITSGFAIIQSQVCVGFKASNEGGAMANANLALTVMGITVALAGMVTHALLYL